MSAYDIFPISYIFPHSNSHIMVRFNLLPIHTYID